MGVERDVSDRVRKRRNLEKSVVEVYRTLLQVTRDSGAEISTDDPFLGGSLH